MTHLVAYEGKGTVAVTTPQTPAQLIAALQAETAGLERQLLAETLLAMDAARTRLLELSAALSLGPGIPEAARRLSDTIRDASNNMSSILERNAR